MSEDKKKVLIIGMAGGLAQITARLLLSKHPQWSVLGVDTRSVKQLTEIQGIETFSMK